MPKFAIYMIPIVGVRFKPITKIYYFDPGPFDDLTLDSWVIVETARGVEMGCVALPPREVAEDEIKGELKQVIRQATPVDLLMAQEYKAQEEAALETCQRLVRELEVPMKVLQASYNFDGSRLLFTFTAEQRVDFRDLVKELAKSLRTRIEMKQVGARDETKILDGYGRCGRQLCCSSWLTEFHPVSIRMAKQQGLPLAPNEISGVCGRLLCCLAYEDEFYTEVRKTLPKVGSRVKLKQGQEGVVRGLNILQETVLVEIEAEDTHVEVQTSEINEVRPKTPPKAKPSGKSKGRSKGRKGGGSDKGEE